MTNPTSHLKRLAVKDLLRASCLVSGTAHGTIRIDAGEDDDRTHYHCLRDYFLRRPYTVSQGETVLCQGRLREVQSFLVGIYQSDRRYYSENAGPAIRVGEYMTRRLRRALSA